MTARVIVLVKVVLELRSSGGVTSPEQRSRPDEVHLPLARDPFPGPDEERLYLPASSLAGSLRAHLRTVPGVDVTALMGGEPGADITASALRLCGTRVESAGIARVPHTAIDRHRGAPSRTQLRAGELLRPGSRITAYLRLDRSEFDADLLTALRTWAPVIGRGRTSGHGRAAVVELRHRRIDLGTPAGRRTWLTGGGPDLYADEFTEPVEVPTVTEPEPVLRLDWEIVDGLRVGTGDREPKEGTGSLVALILRDQNQRPYVPGTTWKGVLRSRCEFILRSLGQPACAPETRPACETCVICRGFGFTGPGRDAPSRRGALTFLDSPVDDAEIARRAHAPQDRVFGGVKDGLLFTEEVVTSGRLTLAILPTGHHQIPDDLVALLRLACRDLDRGLVGVGGSVTRGLGTLRLIGAEES